MKKLENQTIAELEDLRGKIDDLLAEKRTAEKLAVRQRILEEIKASGFTTEEVIGSHKKKSNGSKRKKDPSREMVGPNGERWSGYGRPPAWVSEMQS